jgi:hypothetical protein
VTISPHHEQGILLPRGITADDASRFGVRSILTADELPEELRTNRYAATPGLLFTWNSPLAGTVLQLRPDEPLGNPQGDAVKYVFGTGQEMVLNRLRETGDGPLLVQEGTMQSLAAAIYAHEGWSIYGMSGCWSWRKGETQVAIPDLMVVDGRDVIISLDADAATNRDVYDAGVALREAMEAEGAHSVRFLWLGGHGKKAGLDDVLGSRPAERRTEYLMRALQHAEEKPAKARPTKRERGSGGSAKALVIDPSRPTIMVNDDRRDVINAMTEALAARWNGRELFGYGGILAWRTAAAVAPVTEGVFADLIAEAALCVTVSAKGDMTPAWPDEKSMKAVLSRADRFALLERMSQVPFVRPDGSIVQTSGYDRDTATFLLLDESVSAVEVPDSPGEEDVRSAVKLLTEEWLGDLFQSMPEPEDRANCLALMITPLIRGLVPLAPMAVIDGLQPGVGKNLIADLLSILATGKPASPLPYSRDDDENRKLITSSFRAGSELLIFDEAHTVEGRHLARSITGETYSDRILGVSNMIEFPNKITWVALGNNVVVNGDLSRRVYRIRLAPAIANPQDRDVATFRHPDIKRWTREHRSELIGAALTLVRAWFTGEREESAAGRRFGSFERWGGLVGGILDNAGIDGFLGSLVEWRSETDYETKFWTDHLHWLLQSFGDEEFTVPEVVQKMKRSNHVEHPPRLEDHSSTGYNRSLGLAYSRVHNRVIGNLQLVKTATFAGHSNKWMVRDHRPPVPEPTFAQKPTKEGMDEYRALGQAVLAESDESITPDPPVENGSSGSTGSTSLPPLGKDHYPYNVYTPIESSPEGTGTRIYPLYPNYPSTDGADPLSSLLPLCIDVPARICPDCEQPEELTPSGLWYACPRCTPRTFIRD